MEIRNYEEHQKGLVLNFLKERYELYKEQEKKNKRGEVYGHYYLFKKPYRFLNKTFYLTFQVDVYYKTSDREESCIHMYSYTCGYAKCPWCMWSDQAARFLNTEVGWSMHYCKIQASRFLDVMCDECRIADKELERLFELAA